MDQEDTIEIIKDADEDMDMDDLFKSMVEQKGIKKFEFPHQVDFTVNDTAHDLYSPFADCLPVDID